MSPEPGAVSQPGGRWEHGEQGGEGRGGGGREVWQVSPHSQVNHHHRCNTLYTSARIDSDVTFLDAGSYRARSRKPTSPRGLISFHAGKYP